MKKGYAPPNENWERAQLKQYILNYASMFSQWEIDGTVLDPRDGTLVELDVHIDGSKVSVNPPNRLMKRPAKRGIMLAEGQIKLLQDSLVFYKAMNAVLNKKGPYYVEVAKADNLNELVEIVLERGLMTERQKALLDRWENEEKKISSEKELPQS